MKRFYCPDADFRKDTIEISNPQEIHHLKNVLRLKSLDQIKLFNQHGEEIAATILTIEKDKLTVRKDLEIPRRQRKSTVVELACAIPKKAKFEWIIEKATELNADSIVPLITRRTEIILDAERAAKKRERYQTIAINAAKQCGRTTVPDIKPILSFPEFLKSATSGSLLLIPCLNGERRGLFEIFEEIETPAKITIIIGPEGDFTDEELKLAQKHGCQPVTLGPTVLKVDTAALAALGWLQLYLDHEITKN